MIVVTAVRSREGSPRMPRPRSEEIPLEDIVSSQGGSVAGAIPQPDPTLPSTSSSTASPKVTKSSTSSSTQSFSTKSPLY